MRLALHISRSLALVLALSLGGLSAHAESDFTVQADLEQTTAKVGEYFTITFSITYPDSIRLTVPELQQKLGDFELHSSDWGGFTKAKNKQFFSGVIRLWALNVGPQTIPGLTLSYVTPDSATHSIRTTAFPVTVESVIGAEADSAQPRPMREPFEDPFELAGIDTSNRAVIIASIIGVLLLAFLIWWLFIRKRAEEKRREDTRTPWEKAFARLAELNAANMAESGAYKEYYSELTNIMKEYLGRMFEFPALDMTSTETLYAMDNDAISENYKEQMKQLFSGADRVKFAKFTPSSDLPRRDFDMAYTVIQEIKDELLARRRAEALKRQQEEAAKAGREKANIAGVSQTSTAVEEHERV